MARRPSLRLRRPPPLDTAVAPPGSKSLTNRALLLAALAEGASTLRGVLVADDSLAMRSCLERLGVEIGERDATTWRVGGRAGRFAAPRGEGPLDARAAGTVARFLTAALAAVGCGGSRAVRLDGTPRLRERPMGLLVDALRHQGARVHGVTREGHLPLEIEPSSRVRGGRLGLERPASSQLVSALVLAAALAPEPTRIALRRGTPARPYVDMTLATLEHFGGRAGWEPGDVITVEPRPLRARDYAVEPDASAASYFLALAAIHGGRARVPGLGRASLQGDAAFCRVLERMGAAVEQDEAATTVAAGELLGARLDLTDMPDMTLTAAVTALFARGPTEIRGVEILRYHESDRLAAAATELRKLGAAVEERADGLRIEPPAGGPRAGVAIDTYDDHRMAMAFAMVGDVEIRDPDCAAKTFPGYFDELARLGMDPSGSGGGGG